MAARSGWYASQLRQELAARARLHARGRAHAESYGSSPVIVFPPEDGKHGNFFDDAYTAIAARPEWMRRFDKVHTQGRRSLPKPVMDHQRLWRELDSSMSSDALLMNIFCAPGVAESAAVRGALGVDGEGETEFGWKAKVPLASGRFDRTEVDMRMGNLLVEAKLTEGDFQTREARIVEAYRDFDEIFERELLPRVAMTQVRRKEAVEFPEAFSQEYESLIDQTMPRALVEELRANSASAIAAEDFNATRKGEAGYRGYQLIRNVLGAHATGSSFCVLLDERRPDLREDWFEVMAAVKSAAMRVRLKVMTWQELAAYLPEELQAFLDLKYGIVAPGRIPSALVEGMLE
jgi:hypothetical protein